MTPGSGNATGSAGDQGLNPLRVVGLQERQKPGGWSEADLEAVGSDLCNQSALSLFGKHATASSTCMLASDSDSCRDWGLKGVPMCAPPHTIRARCCPGSLDVQCTSASATVRQGSDWHAFVLLPCTAVCNAIYCHLLPCTAICTAICTAMYCSHKCSTSEMPITSQPPCPTAMQQRTLLDTSKRHDLVVSPARLTYCPTIDGLRLGVTSVSAD